MSKHTDGPWFCGQDGFNLGNGVVYARHANGNPKAICHVHGWGADQQANTRLISATPDLLEALEEMVSNEEQVEFESWLSDFSPSGDCESVTAQWYESSRYEDFCLAVEKQLNAIAKARGEK